MLNGPNHASSTQCGGLADMLTQAFCFLRSSSHPSSGKDGVHDRFLLDMKSVAICVVSLQTECRPLKHFSLQTYYN